MKGTRQLLAGAAAGLCALAIFTAGPAQGAVTNTAAARTLVVNERGGRRHCIPLAPGISFKVTGDTLSVTTPEGIRLFALAEGVSWSISTGASTQEEGAPDDDANSPSEPEAGADGVDSVEFLPSEQFDALDDRF